MAIEDEKKASKERSADGKKHDRGLPHTGKEHSTSGFRGGGSSDDKPEQERCLPEEIEEMDVEQMKKILYDEILKRDKQIDSLKKQNEILLKTALKNAEKNAEEKR